MKNIWQKKNWIQSAIFCHLFVEPNIVHNKRERDAFYYYYKKEPEMYLPVFIADNSCEIKCVAFSRMIYQDAHWNMKRSYRLDGKLFPEQNLVSFPILDAIPIENGKILEAAVSPTVAPRQAEASPSQNNPSSAVKANRDRSRPDQ